jgi:hypothetical protein
MGYQPIAAREADAGQQSSQLWKTSRSVVMKDANGHCHMNPFLLVITYLCAGAGLTIPRP